MAPRSSLSGPQENWALPGLPFLLSSCGGGEERQGADHEGRAGGAVKVLGEPTSPGRPPCSSPPSAKDPLSEAELGSSAAERAVLGPPRSLETGSRFAHFLLCHSFHFP